MAEGWVEDAEWFAQEGHDGLDNNWLEYARLKDI